MSMTKAMFGTPNRGNQSSNINQLTPDWVNIAYQVNDSLLAGGESVKVDSLNNTIALNYGITGSQSDKLSSDHSVNILAQYSAKSFAQQLAKILADVLAKIYAYQSGEYFLGQSAKYFADLERINATPFPPMRDKSYLVVLSINTSCGGILTTGGIEFFESIKKGSYLATQSCQFFGSMPNRSNSFRPRVLSQLPKLIPASDAADSNCALSSGVILIWNVGDNPFPFSVLSLFGVDMYVRNLLVCYLLCTYFNMKYVQNKTPSNDITSITQGLTTNDTDSIEVAMQDINTPVIGRTSLTPNQSYRWLFLALNRSDYTAKPCRIAVTAPNENSARLMLVRDYMLIFAGRLPAQEVTA